MTFTTRRQRFWIFLLAILLSQFIWAFRSKGDGLDQGFIYSYVKLQSTDTPGEFRISNDIAVKVTPGSYPHTLLSTIDGRPVRFLIVPCPTKRACQE